MADSSSYKRYGIRSENPMMGLVAGQNAVNNSFNSALDKVGELLAEELTGAKNTNTANMQSYLQQKLGDQGLAADPVDMVNIKKKFGNLIDMDQLANTEKNKRGEMTKDAVDLAGTFGLNKYNETGNLADAGTAFRQKLLDAGMGALEADQKTSEWRAANNYRATDEATALKEKTDTMLADIGKIWAKGGSEEDSDKYIIDNFPEKYQAAAKQAARKYRKDLAGYSDQDLADVADLSTKLGTDVTIQKTAYDDAYNSIQGQLDALDEMSPESQAIGDEAFRTLGGDEAFNEKGEFKETLGQGAINSFFQLFTGNVTGKDARKYLQDNISSMIDAGVPRSRAVSIAIKAYDTAKANNSAFNIGNAIDKEAFTKKLTPMFANALKRKQLSSDLAEAGSRRSLGMAALQRKNDSLMRKFRKELTNENLGQGTFDQSSYFADRIADASGSGSGGSGEGDASGNGEKKKSAYEIARDKIMGTGSTGGNGTPGNGSSGNSSGQTQTGDKGAQDRLNTIFNNSGANPKIMGSSFSDAEANPPQIRTTESGETVAVQPSPMSRYLAYAKTDEGKQRQVNYLQERLDREMKKKKSKQRPNEIKRWEDMIKRLNIDLAIR